MTKVKRLLEEAHKKRRRRRLLLLSPLFDLLMPLSSFSPDTTVLLVLLPLPSVGGAPHEAQTTAWIHQLQKQLGAAIRVLRIDEASHPLVVLSFHLPALPACVLVRRGVELWRQQGLPEGESFVPTLLKLAQAV
jgi:hypothetical protein